MLLGTHVIMLCMHSPSFEIYNVETSAGEMALLLRALAAPPEDLSSVPTTTSGCSQHPAALSLKDLALRPGHGRHCTPVYIYTR